MDVDGLEAELLAVLADFAPRINALVLALTPGAERYAPEQGPAQAVRRFYAAGFDVFLIGEDYPADVRSRGRGIRSGYGITIWVVLRDGLVSVFSPGASQSES